MPTILPAILSAIGVGTLAALLSVPAAAQLPGDYPTDGKALDTPRSEADYADLIAERPRAVAIMRARAHGFVPSAEIHSYVDGILTRLLDGVALPPSFAPDIRVLAAPDYGAVCTPDGTVIVSIGLLEQSESEDEIAFILGHEISHAILRHHDSDWFTRTQYYAVLNARSLSDMTGGISVQGGGIGDTLGDIQRGIAIATKVYELSESVLAPQFQQGQEDQADALGFDLMVRAGYNPEGARLALDRLALAEQAAAQAAEQAAEQARESEQDRPQRRRSGGGLFGALGSVNLGGFGSLDLGRLTETALDLGIETLAENSKPHRPAQERAEFLAEYQFREYRDLIPGELQPLPWPAATGFPTAPTLSIAGTITNYRNANVLIDQLQGMEVQDVELAAIHSVNPPTAGHAYTLFALSRLRASQQRDDEARRARQRAVASPEPSWIAYNAEIDARIADDDLAGAEDVMTAAVLRFEDSPVLLPKHISILTKLGRDDEARQLMDQCDAYDIRELRDQCEAARG